MSYLLPALRTSSSVLPRLCPIPVMLLIMMLLTGGGPFEVEASPSVPTTSQLESAFSDQAQIEAIVLCFEGRSVCTQEQNYIKVRVKAMMNNFGNCPQSLCNAEDRKRMSHSMHLLLSKYPDMLGRMIKAMSS
ncbi:uncharacterized protein LOC143039175 [Oratosquilla oratoria]|uniref:uncharacterized protein LOC143039175 n=1 Tax=Oratosquilla oratoria TaxID=337810 RepID=UPI003F75F775